jgi:hypothetical protein
MAAQSDDFTDKELEDLETHVQSCVRRYKAMQATMQDIRAGQKRIERAVWSALGMLVIFGGIKFEELWPLFLSWLR